MLISDAMLQAAKSKIGELEHAYGDRLRPGGGFRASLVILDDADLLSVLQAAFDVYSDELRGIARAVGMDPESVL